DPAFRALAAEDGVQILHYWPRPPRHQPDGSEIRDGQAEPATAAESAPVRPPEILDVLLTTAERLDGDPGARDAIDSLRSWMDGRPEIFRVEQLPLRSVLTPPRSDAPRRRPAVWIHLGHGGNDAAGVGRLLEERQESGSGRSLGPYALRHRTPIDAALMLLLSCEVGTPGPHSGASLPRLLVELAEHVVGFGQPLPVELALRFARRVLADLGRGHTIEEAVAAARFALCSPDEPENGEPCSADLEVPVPWAATLPILHTAVEEPRVLRLADTSALETRLRAAGRLLVSELEQEQDGPRVVPSSSNGGREAASRPIGLARHQDSVFIEPQLKEGGPAVETLMRLLGLDAHQKVRDVKAHPAILLGNTGQGKTTLLHNLVAHLSEDPEERRIPILLPLERLQKARRQLAEAGHGGTVDVFQALYRSLSDAAARATGDGEGGGDAGGADDAGAGREGLRHLLRHGRILLLLDGLDEVVDLTRGDSLEAWASFLGPLFRLAGASVALTCRLELHVVDRLELAFPKSKIHQLRPWSETEIRDYLERRGVESAAHQSLLEWGKEILTTPLFACFAANFLQRVDTGESWARARLTRAMTREWAGREARKVRSLDVSPGHLLDLSTAAAHMLKTRGLKSVEIETLKSAVNRSRQLRRQTPLPEGLDKLLTFHSMLIVKRGKASFAHPIFRDYFAARQAAEHLRSGPVGDDLLWISDYQHLSVAAVRIETTWLEQVAELVALDLEDRDAFAARIQRLRQIADRLGAGEAPDGKTVDAGAACFGFLFPLATLLEHLAPSAEGLPAGAAPLGADRPVCLRGLRVAGRELRQLTLANLCLERCEFDAVRFVKIRFHTVRFESCKLDRCDVEACRGLGSIDFADSEWDRISQGSWELALLGERAD
ncbi:MAG: NACHT domain-containing protein, partial [Holophagales bacterium]|nr:NACHT domain-containing protein [Holophagales bacterium]